jgi:xanthine dehydrogenase accessory factor
MIVIDNDLSHGEIIGSIGGGAIEHLIRREAILAIHEQQSRLVTSSLKNDLGMCCGGTMTVFIEPIRHVAKLICFGAGHIGQALCPLAFDLGFEVSIVDHRKDFLQNDAFAKVSHRYDDATNFSIANMAFSRETYVVIATHDHDLDQKIAESILGQTFKYAAMVGSVRKALMMKKRLLAKGYEESHIAKICCPAGLDIRANTPQEIAISIASQMIMVKNASPTISRVDCGGRPEQANGFK